MYERKTIRNCQSRMHHSVHCSFVTPWAGCCGSIPTVPGPINPKASMFDCHRIIGFPNIAGWWFQPLWKIWKSVGMMTFPYIMENKKCSKPPTRLGFDMVLQSFLYDSMLQKHPYWYGDGDGPNALLVWTHPQQAELAAGCDYWARQPPL